MIYQTSYFRSYIKIVEVEADRTPDQKYWLSRFQWAFLLVRMVGATDIGRRRKTNQDSIFFDEPAGLGIVADGIGGRKGGEIASSIAVNGLRKAFMNSDRIRHEEIKPFLITAIDQINREIIDRGTIET